MGCKLFDVGGFLCNGRDIPNGLHLISSPETCNYVFGTRQLPFSVLCCADYLLLWRKYDMLTAFICAHRELRTCERHAIFPRSKTLHNAQKTPLKTNIVGHDLTENASDGRFGPPSTHLSIEWAKISKQIKKKTSRYS